MRGRSAGRAAWGLWLVDVVTVAWLLSMGSEGAGLSSSLAGALFVLAFATTGALVASRHPGNPVGWLLALAGLAFTIGGACEEISQYAVEESRPDLLAARAAAWVGGFVWMLGVGPAATFLLLLFPDGRLPSSRWRPVAWLAGVAMALVVGGVALAPGRIDGTEVTNPVGLPVGGAALEGAVAVGLVLLFVSILASCASLVVRFRSAGREQRQQLKWVAYSLPVVMVWLAGSAGVEWTYSSDTAVDIANTLVSIGLTAVPVGMGIAMLRHRLYDIDLVINRTLVYASLTALLAGVYLASVLVLQLLLAPLTAVSDLAVVASTLAVASLFRPARTRIQAAVDRHFYRRRYDAAETLQAYADRLRHELDLEAVAAGLKAAARDTVQPAHMSLWLRS